MTTAGEAPRPPTDAIDRVKHELEELVVERQRLRETDADAGVLEANRRAIADRQLRFAHLAWRCYGTACGSPPFA
jgi:hypothetical protein